MNIVKYFQPTYGEEEVSVVNSDPYEDVQTHPTLNALPVSVTNDHSNIYTTPFRFKRVVIVIRETLALFVQMNMEMNKL